MIALRPNSGAIEAQWMEQGMEVLFNCRKALQYSYAFGYYLFDDTNTDRCRDVRNFAKEQRGIAQTIFEDNQQELENATEKLSHLLEKDVEELFEESTKKDIMGVSVLADRRFLALFDVIRTDLMENENSIPRPKSVLTGSSGMAASVGSLLSMSNTSKVSKVSGTAADDEEMDLQRAIQLSLQNK